MLTVRLLLLASLAAPAAPAAAQPAASAPADTARFYRHHLGLTASPQLDQFFKANRSLPVGLLYKRQTAPNKLWRFGVVLNQDYRRQDESEPPPPYPKSNAEFVNNDFGIGVSVGEEFTRRFAPHWTGAIGVDASVGFSLFLRETKSQRVGTGSLSSLVVEDKTVARNRYYQAALTPFVALRYAIWPSVYLSAESAIRVNYVRDVFDAYGTTTILSTGQIIFGSEGFSGQTLTYQFLALRYRVINQLALHYTLGKR